MSDNSNNSYRIPCVFCSGRTSFASSVLLKEHLIAEHSNSVSPTKYRTDDDSDAPIDKSYSSKLFGIPVQSEPLSKSSVKVSQLSNPSESQHSDLPESYSSFRSYNSITSQEEELAKVKSEAEVKINLAEQKVSQLSESLSKKSILLDRLQVEVDNLKSKLQFKEEEHKKLKQKWRREAEEAVRSWAAKYENLGSRNSTLERQLAETEDEVARLRTEREKMVKDMADMETREAEITKMQRLDFREQAKKIAQKLESERHATKTLSTDLQSLRKEKETLAEALAAKADSIKTMKTSLINVRAELTKEKEKNELLLKEKSTLTGEMKRLHDAADAYSSNSSERYEAIDSRLKRLQAENAELQSNLRKIEKLNDANQTVVATLQQEKQKLVHRLQEADESLSELTTRVATPTRASSEKLGSRVVTASPFKRQSFPSSSSVGSSAVPFADDMRRNLDSILSAVSQITRRDTADASRDAEEQISQLKIKLLEEQSVTRDLRDKLACTERLVEQYWTAEDGTLIDEKFLRIQVKHNKFEKLRSDYKQKRKLKREKMNLNRKCISLSHELQLQKVLHDQLECKSKEIGERMARISQENKVLSDDLTKCVAREQLACENLLETQKNVEKFSHDNKRLLEKILEVETKLSTSKIEMEHLQQRYSENLCSDITSNQLQFLEAAVEKLETNLRKVSSGNLSTKVSVDDTRELVKSFAKQNVLLSKELIECRRSLISERKAKEMMEIQNEDAKQKIDEKLKQEVCLRKEINRLEEELAKSGQAQCSQLPIWDEEETGEKEIVLHHEATIESLILERDILSSRVVILESIREEIEILRNEKMRLQVENENLRRQLQENNIEVITPRYHKSTANEIAVSSDLLNLPSTASSVDLNKNKSGEFPKTIFTYDTGQPLSTEDAFQSESTVDLVVLSAIPVDSISEADKQSLVEALASSDFQSLLSKETVSICDHPETRSFSRTDSAEGELSVEFLIERIQMDEAGTTCSADSLEGFSSSDSVSSDRASHRRTLRDIVSRFADDEANFSDEIDETIEYVQKELKMLTPTSSESSAELASEQHVAPLAKFPDENANINMTAQIKQKNSIFQDHLKRLLSQSRNISESIAAAESRPETYRNLIESFKKMVVELNASGLHSKDAETAEKQELPAACASSSHRSCKKVKFSDHTVEFMNPTDSENSEISGASGSSLGHNSFQKPNGRSYTKSANYHVSDEDEELESLFQKADGLTAITSQSQGHDQCNTSNGDVSNNLFDDFAKDPFKIQKTKLTSRISGLLPYSTYDTENLSPRAADSSQRATNLQRTTESQTSHDLSKQREVHGDLFASTDSLRYIMDETMKRTITLESASNPLVVAKSPQNLLKKSKAVDRLSHQASSTLSGSPFATKQDLSMTDMTISISNESLHDAPVVFFLDEPTLSDDDEESLFGRGVVPNNSVPVASSDVKTTLREKFATHQFPHEIFPHGSSSLLPDITSPTETLSDQDRVAPADAYSRTFETATGKMHSSTPSFEHKEPYLDFSDFSID